jgi:hypothetical protein
MSQSSTSRAIEYLAEPREVEVYRAQTWVLGSMVGWCHESADSCRVLVRVTEGRTEKTVWSELEHVRLLEYRTQPCPEQWTIQLLVARARADERLRSGSSANGDLGPDRTGRHRAHGESPGATAVGADDGSGPLPRRRRTDASPPPAGQGRAARQRADELTHPITLAAAARQSPGADLFAVVRSA